MKTAISDFIFTIGHSEIRDGVVKAKIRQGVSLIQAFIYLEVIKSSYILSRWSWYCAFSFILWRCD